MVSFFVQNLRNLGLGMVVVVAALSACERSSDEGNASVAEAAVVAEAPASFVGSAACASCHAAEHAAWQGSHHQRAMEPADERTVLGNFADASFEYYGRTTRFTRDGARFVVTTENERGQQEAFRVAFTLGLEPLQQYLVAFDDGRIQALPFAWDTRPAAAGGQRWFHLYPNEDVKPDSPLFWTRAQQNWNHMCGECHTTGFEKSFSEATSRFDSRHSELGNGCESCHGAGSQHVATRGSSMLALGDQAAQIDQCGVCHARRVRLSPPPEGRERMHETWRPELVQSGLYFDDGQIRDEVFEVGSFLQSKMAMNGVRCTNCHDPHTARLKAEGNALCTQCHDRKYDSEQHHLHASSTQAAQCVSCHMPTRTYMVVDARRDHRIAVPRPDLSDALGTPNACASCHADKGNAWAAQAIASHRTSDAPRAATLGPVLAGAHRAQPGAESAASAWLADPQASPIGKASVIAALGELRTPDAAAEIARQARSDDPWRRLGASLALQRAPNAASPDLLAQLASGTTRAVRLIVAPLFARSSDAGLSPERRRTRALLREELVRWLATDADRANALVTLANVQRAGGDHDAARGTLHRALQRDETSLLARLNLADYHRSVRADDQAEVLLRDAVRLYPESADARAALGLLLVRKKELAGAVAELERATALAPDNREYAQLHELARQSYCTQPAAASSAACR